MAKKTPKNKLHINVLTVAFLMIAIIIAVIAVSVKTNMKSQAGNFPDLNTAHLITKTNYSDGTMGPRTWKENLSNSLSPNMLGKLELKVTDPPSGNVPKGTSSGGPKFSKPVILPTGAGDDITPISKGKKPASTGSTGAEMENNSNKNKNQGEDENRELEREREKNMETKAENAGGFQTVTALNMSIKKAEVHLIRLASQNQGSRKQQIPPGQARLTTTPETKIGTFMDKWETLDTGGTQSFDLMNLAAKQLMDSLGITSLAAGSYSEIRLYVESANATLENGQTVDLEIPGRLNIVRIVKPFTVTAGETLGLVVDFDAQRSVLRAGNRYFLKPVIARFMTE